MKLFPGQVLEQLSYLDFQNRKHSLAQGTYQVTEADGEINYAVLGYFRGLLTFQCDWYTESEYFAERQHANAMDLSFDDRDGEELMDSWDDAMHRDHDEQRRFNAVDNGFGVEVEHVEDGDLTDTEYNQMVGEVYERNEEESRAFGQRMDSPAKTLGELLRESMASPMATESGGYQIATQEDHDAFMAKRNTSLSSDPVRDESGDCHLLRGFNA